MDAEIRAVPPPHSQSGGVAAVKGCSVSRPSAALKTFRSMYLVFLDLATVWWRTYHVDPDVVSKRFKKLGSLHLHTEDSLHRLSSCKLIDSYDIEFSWCTSVHTPIPSCLY